MNGPRKWQIACPAGSVTGGPEALHQFAHTARTLGIDRKRLYRLIKRYRLGDCHDVATSGANGGR